jgi:hypothetical protein
VLARGGVRLSAARFSFSQVALSILLMSSATWFAACGSTPASSLTSPVFSACAVIPGSAASFLSFVRAAPSCRSAIALCFCAFWPARNAPTGLL